MRLRLNIKRHELPPVQVLHGVSHPTSTTISELVSQVNNIVPLESADGAWGLEDYIVSVGGFECVHFSHVADILKEDDEVEIRAAQTVDNRTRRLTGRTQVTREGARLLDGLPYGSRRMRPTPRPAVRIPPLKRRRLLAPGDDDEEEEARFADEIMDDSDEDEDEAEKSYDTLLSEDEEEDVDEDEVALLQNDEQPSRPTSSGSGKRVRIQAPQEDPNSDESESDFALPGEDIDSDTSASSSAESDDSSDASSSEASNDGDTSVVNRKERNATGSVERLQEPESASSSGESDEETDSETSSSSSSSSDENESDVEDEDLPTTITNPSAGASTGPSLNNSPKRSAHAARPSSAKTTIDHFHNYMSGLVHPSMQAHYMPITSTPPGKGKLSTKKRNVRRKSNKRRKFMEVKMARNEEPDVVVNLQQEQAAISAEQQALANNGAGQDRTAQNQPMQANEGEAMEALRNRLLNTISATGDEDPGQLAESVREAEAESEEMGEDPIVESPEAAKADDVPIAPTSNETTASTTKPEASGPRLRFGDAGRRTLIAALAPRQVKKKKPVQEAKPSSPKQASKRHWEDVIKLSVIECGATDIDLPVPPYPFKQRWHGISGQTFAKRKRDYMKPILEKYGVSVADAGHKRKRGDDDFIPLDVERVEEEPAIDAVEQTEYDRREKRKSTSEKGLNYDDEEMPDQPEPRPLLSYDDPGEGLNYDDDDEPPEQASSRRSRRSASPPPRSSEPSQDADDTSGDSRTLQRSSNAPSMTEDDRKDVEEGYPLEPLSTDQVEPLTWVKCEPGLFIYFKKLEIGRHGSPELSAYRTALVTSVDLDDRGRTVELKLARRDAFAPIERAGHDSRSAEEKQMEGRLWTLDWEDFVDPKLIKSQSRL